jgi:hypothetical protein
MCLQIIQITRGIERIERSYKSKYSQEFDKKIKNGAR